MRETEKKSTIPEASRPSTPSPQSLQDDARDEFRCEVPALTRHDKTHKEATLRCEKSIHQKKRKSADESQHEIKHINKKKTSGHNNLLQLSSAASLLNEIGNLPMSPGINFGLSELCDIALLPSIPRTETNSQKAKQANTSSSQAAIKKYTCDFPECTKSYKQKFILNRHKRLIHNTSGSAIKFTCDFPECTQAYKLKDSLNRHKRKIHKVTSGSTVTSTSSQKAKQANTFSSQAAIKKFTCDFPECTKNYKSNFALKRHKRATHNTSGSAIKFTCDFPECTQAYKLKSSLNRHKRKIHKFTSGPTVTSTSVENTMPLPSASNESARLIEVSQPEIRTVQSCTVPGEAFMTCPEPTHQLPTESKVENTETNSQKAKQANTSSNQAVIRFTCDFPKCTKNYKYDSTLKRHKRETHNTSGSAIKFTCDFPKCTKSYKQKYILNRHKRLIHNTSGSTVTSTSVENTMPLPSASDESARLIEVSQPEIGTVQSCTVPGEAFMTCPEPTHPSSSSESQILSITRAIKNIRNLLAMIPSIPPSTPEKIELQVSSISLSIKNLLLLMFSKLPLSFSPKQFQLQITMTTDFLRGVVFIMLSQPSSKEERNSQIDSVIDTIKNLVDEMVLITPIKPVKQEIIDLTPSNPEPGVDTLPTALSLNSFALFGSNQISQVEKPASTGNQPGACSGGV
jgi:hypothetical protein